MAYQKFLVDNVVCSRRFHLAFDDETPKENRVEIRCTFCEVVLFEATNHPAVRLSRQENLVKTAILSDKLIDVCHFKDVYSEKTVPHSATSLPDPRR